MKPMHPLILCLMIAGCGSVPRPNYPSETRYVQAVTVKPDGSATKTVTIEHTGTENETRSAPLRVSPEGGMELDSGRAVGFDWSVLDQVSDTYIWLGAAIAVVGLVLMFAPIPLPFVKSLGLPLAIGGAGFACLPLVAAQLRILVLVGGLAAMAAAAVYGLWRAGKLKGMVLDGIDDRTAAGDADGAGALAYVATGGDKSAAKAAKAMAKGSGKK